jgi:hypothetical protein
MKTAILILFWQPLKMVPTGATAGCAANFHGLPFERCLYEYMANGGAVNAFRAARPGPENAATRNFQ